MGDGLLEQLADMVVIEVVDDLAALAASDDESEVAEDPELMGDGRGLHAHRGRELVDRGWAAVQRSEDVQPARGGERLHRLGDGLGEIGLELGGIVLVVALGHEMRIAERTFRCLVTNATQLFCIRYNNSGSILGVGKGSEAVFSSTEEYIGDEVSSCPNDAGFIAFSVFCSSKRIKPLGYVGYSAGPLTNNYKTVETNNLTPVIGSPPTHLPGLAYFGPYVAQVVYVASTSGKCFTGSPPYC